MSTPEEIEGKIKLLLSKAIKGPVDSMSEDMIEEFGEACMNAMRKQFKTTRNPEFRLRMSNIGKDLRSLMLEREYGEGEKDPEFKLLVCYGDLIEALLVLVMKAADVNITSQSEKVALNVGDTKILGEYDITIDDLVYDIKSCSPYAFDRKFAEYDLLRDHDDFGYLGQLFGYSCATTGTYSAGGWIVVNKVNGHIKVLEIPRDRVAIEQKEYVGYIKDKVAAMSDPDYEMPPCMGVIEETFRKKPTGNLILNKTCEFCTHKDKCHPGLEYLPQAASSAKVKPMKYYVPEKAPEDLPPSIEEAMLEGLL